MGSAYITGGRFSLSLVIPASHTKASPHNILSTTGLMFLKMVPSPIILLTGFVIFAFLDVSIDGCFSQFGQFRRRTGRNTRLQSEEKETAAILLENQGRAGCYKIAESDTWVWAGSQEERKTLCDETAKCVKEAFLLGSDWDVCQDIPFENCLKLAGDDKGEKHSAIDAVIVSMRLG